MNYNKGNWVKCWGSILDLRQTLPFLDHRAQVGSGIPECVYVYPYIKGREGRKALGLEARSEKWWRKRILKWFKTPLAQMTWLGWCPEWTGPSGSCKRTIHPSTTPPIWDPQRSKCCATSTRSSQRDQPTSLLPVGRNPSNGLVNSFINHHLFTW